MTTVYLLHYDKPLHHARHYVGCTCDLENRLRLHKMGHSTAKITAAFHDHGSTFMLARIWETVRGFELESHIKKHYKATVKLCPICNPANHHGEFRKFMK